MFSAFLPDQEVLDVALKVEDVTPSTSKALQDAQVTSENEITLYTEASKLKANDKLSFTLLNLAEGITFTGSSDVTGTRKSSTKTSMDVKVPAKLGDYSFTLSNSGKAKTVTVHVIDATMPTSYSFENWREDDIGSIKEEDIKSNTSNVKSATTFSTSANGDITFSGNVNTMTGTVETGRFYRVRIKLNDKTDINSVKAVSKDGKEYTVTPVSNAEHTIFVDLNAEEATTDLVIANKNASKKQIEKETTSSHTVTFKSTSKIWVRNARKIGDFTNKDSITKVSVDQINNHLIELNVKFDSLKNVELNGDTSNITETKSEAGDKWIPFIIELSETTGSTVKSAVYADKSEDVKIMNNKTLSPDKEGIVVWVKSNGTDGQKIEFKLHYNKSNETTEELPVTVVLHDVTAPVVEDVTTTTTGILNAKVGSNKNTITLDSYKYGMDATVERKDENGKTVVGRWYSLALKTNIPVSSLVYKNPKTNKWDEIPEDMILDDNIVVWLNANETISDPVITLANKYTVEVGDTVSTNKVDVTVTRTEKSKVELVKATDTVSTDGLISTPPKTLQGVTIEQISVKNAPADAKLGEFKDLLTASKTLNIVNDFDKYDALTVTINVNSNDVKTVSVNGEPGKWILVQMAIQNNHIEENSIKDENEDHSAVIIDPRNDSKLLTDIETGNKTGLRVPIWINLTSDAVKAVTDAGDKTLEVKFGSTTPLTEHNSFKLKIHDTNPMGDEGLSAEQQNPTKFGVNELAGKTTEQQKAYLDEILGTGTLNGAADDDSITKNFVHNLEIMQDADITSEVIDNTVYVTVVADLDELKPVTNKNDNSNNAKTKRATLVLDVSTLGGTKKGDNLWYWSGVSKKWAKCTQDSETDLILDVRFEGYNTQDQQNYNDLCDGKPVTKEYILAEYNNGSKPLGESDRDAALGSVKDRKYIDYVITFVNR